MLQPNISNFWSKGRYTPSLTIWQSFTARRSILYNMMSVTYRSPTNERENLSIAMCLASPRSGFFSLTLQTYLQMMEINTYSFFLYQNVLTLLLQESGFQLESLPNCNSSTVDSTIVSRISLPNGIAPLRISKLAIETALAMNYVSWMHLEPMPFLLMSTIPVRGSTLFKIDSQ